MQAAPAFGVLLREWRARRRMSQLDLAVEAEISSRHLSFIETGRARPSREMILRLGELLAVPLRARNRMLTAGGFAPVFPDRELAAPELQAARNAIDLVLKGHEPFPALAVDRRWMLVAANRMVAPLFAGAAPALLAPPINVLRLSLHPKGLAPKILNLAQWREQILARLRDQIAASADPVLADLHRELSAYPAPRAGKVADDFGGVAVPLRLATDRGVLSFISTTTVFGTPVDVILSELAIEAFFPADPETAEILRAIAGEAEI